MKSNILKAMNNMTIYGSNELLRFYVGNNRANIMGDALEVFVKDIFCNSFSFNSEEALEKYNETFSYLGNASNPPDIIIRGGDAIEVKKIEGFSSLPLNSSHPKQKIYSDSTMITNACKHCEDDIGGWKEKDLIYFVGNVNKNKLKCLTIVYGDCYSASDEIYLRIKSKIKTGVEEINGIEFIHTNEIGKIKEVDPLGITDLRIRGMWHIENPRKVFNYVMDKYYNEDNEMNVFLIMRKEKYNSFGKEDRNLIENNPFLTMEDIKIKNPDNPANLVEAKLIFYHI